VEKLNEKQKESLAYEILSLLKEHELENGVWIYFNNKCLDGNGKITDNVRAGDKFEYANDETVSMAFEGAFYEVMPKFTKLLASYGLFYEQGNHSNLAAYYIESYPEEETAAEEKEGASNNNPIYIRKASCPAALEPARAEWEKRQNDYGDVGSCVIDAGFRFVFDGLFYKMPPQGCTQGSISWEASVDYIQQMLVDAGCKDVSYNCGVMD
jgi:hypothetical protein